MKIKEFMQAIYDATDPVQEHYEKTCDVLKIGNPDAELAKVAVSMFATPAVVREAAAWGANLLIVHEPTFYQHWDNPAELDATPDYIHNLIEAKRAYINNFGMTVYRYHDHPHFRVPDLISAGQTKYWGLSGTWKRGKYYAVNEFELDKPMPVLEVAKILSEKLEVPHLRIAGSRETVVQKIGLNFGTPGHIQEAIRDNDLVLTGEICEWEHGEFVRDWVALTGQPKTIMVLGHILSERQGMRLLAERLTEKYPEIPARYFDCGTTYSYID